MSQLETKKERNSQSLKDTRKRFLLAYERTYGNVSASCEFAGISRQTYYRWMRSTSKVNRKFQEKVNGSRPQDRLVDLAESKLVQKINEGDVAAIIYTLKTRGRGRGWAEKREQASPDSTPSPLDQAMRAFRLWLDDHPSTKVSERVKWAARFAAVAGVESGDLLRSAGIKDNDKVSEGSLPR
jgi:hypothetical protein